MKTPRNIRFPNELESAIEAEANIDHRDFSDEVRRLCRLGLEVAMRQRSGSDFSSGQARELAAALEEERR